MYNRVYLQPPGVTVLRRMCAEMYSHVSNAQQGVGVMLMAQLMGCWPRISGAWQSPNLL
jgi:hypothetical protein